MKADRLLLARRELGWMCREGLAWPNLVDETSRVIQCVVPHERFCFHTLDPATMLFTGGVARNLGPLDGYARMVHNELSEEDVNKWAVLARLDHPVGSLSTATHGRRERSIRYRELLRPQQLAWELRASLVSDSLCWGVVGIYRSDGERDFTQAEADFLGSVSTMLGEGFRRSLIVGSLSLEDSLPGDPGLILFDEHNEPVELAPAAERWLEELRGRDDASADWLPVAVCAVQRSASRGDALMESRARVRAPSGRWLTLFGTRLGGAGRTAVIIQPARVPEIAPLIVDSYGLKGRERTITELILKGLSTKEIARAAHISPYTVQDHLKVIFEKTGVRSRRELVALIFHEHHFPRILAGEPPGTDGAFTR